MFDEREFDHVPMFYLPKSGRRKTKFRAPEEYHHYVQVVLQRKGFKQDDPIFDFLVRPECRITLDVEATPDYGVLTIHFLREADAIACRKKFKDRVLKAA
jgi:hypothetical protein